MNPRSTMPCGCWQAGEARFFCAGHFAKLVAIARHKHRAIADILWMIENGRTR